MKLITETKTNTRGIALMLTVVILAAVFGLVISVSTLVLQVIRSNKAIGVSEVAFYAAEAAAELIIYDIEKNGRGLDIIDVVNEPLDTITGATWDSQVRAQTTVPGLCSADQPKVVCGSSSTVTSSNPLSVTLDNGEAFQFEMDLVGASYPDRVTISWSGGSTDVYVMGAGATRVENTSPVDVPESPTVIDPSQDYRFRIENNSGASQVYTITPSVGGAPTLPLGLRITTTGTFVDSQRVIELTRPSWLLY